MVLYRRPPDGQWARTGTVDSSIVRFLLPIGGAALLRLPWRLPFHIKPPRADLEALDSEEIKCIIWGIRDRFKVQVPIITWTRIQMTVPHRLIPFAVSNP